MMQSSLPCTNESRIFYSAKRPSLTSGVALSALLFASISSHAQSPAQSPAPDSSAAAPTGQSVPPSSQTQTINLSNQPAGKTRKQKEEKVVESKDTKTEDKKLKKDNPLQGMDAKLPDKELYDKAMDAIKRGHYDVGRLDLQTLLNTYQDSQFMMRSKLAIADSWFKEGGTAALTQAEQEYRDFITFFPNSPEAAEAQMRIGDIYFREMDRPDRDNSKAIQAEEAYRLMLQQFPDSPRIPEAQQRLREVQESLAAADADVADFYAGRQNWAAAIARYQTIADTYPLYSHMDDVLVSLGDAYEAQAHYYETIKSNGSAQLEAGKARLHKLYEDQAIADYRKVVLEHSASPHVEDARDRLAAMNVPIPVPTAEQAAASAAIENSRGQYTLSKRAELLVLHKADTVPAATIGAPSLQDPKPTLAPTIVRTSVDAFTNAFSAPAANAVASPATPAATAPAEAAASAPEATQAAPAPAAAPLAFQSIPSANGSAPTGPIVAAPASAPPASSSGGMVGMEIVQPSSSSPATPPSANPTAFPGTSAPGAPAPAPANPAPAAKAQVPGAIAPVGPTNNSVLAPVEKAPPAPSAINEAKPGTQPAAQIAAPGAKPAKPACDKADESCSAHKKKKGLARLNPF